MQAIALAVHLTAVQMKNGRKRVAVDPHDCAPAWHPVLVQPHQLLNQPPPNTGFGEVAEAFTSSAPRLRSLILDTGP